jgi:hypothetical protein
MRSWAVAPDCPVSTGQSGNAWIQRSTAADLNGRLTWPGNQTVRYARRQKAAAFCPTTIIVVGAIDITPTATIPHIQTFHSHTFNTRAKN